MLRLSAAASLLAVVLPLCFTSSHGQQCARFENGEVIFEPFPDSSTPVISEEYNSNGLGAWYGMASGFINTVRTGNLPYDQVKEVLNATGITESLLASDGGGSESEGIDPVGLLQELSFWFASIIAVTIIGGILATVFLITGCCFWCCRCCGNCGGSRLQEDKGYHPALMVVFSVILALFTCVLLGGVVLAYFSNQQFYDSVTNVGNVLNSTLDEAVQYVDDTLGEADFILCQYNGISDQVLIEADDFADSLRGQVDFFKEMVYPLLDEAVSIDDDLTTVERALSNVSDVTAVLQTQGETLRTMVMGLHTALTDLSTDCTIALGVAPTLPCNQIPDTSTIDTGANFDELPDVDTELQEVKDAIDGVDILGAVQMGNDTFNEQLQDIDDDITESLNSLKSEVDSFNTQVNDAITDVETSIDKVAVANEGATCDGQIENVGQIRACITDYWQYVEEYDIYVFAFGVVFSCLALIVIILVAVGIILGVTGFRKYTPPHERSSISNCGGIFLLVAVGFAFLVGFLLLILSCILFFLSTPLLKICQSLAGPEYELFVEIVDNSAVWGGSILGQYILQDPNIPLPISGILRDCSNDTALYEAFKLDNRPEFDLSDVANITQAIPDLQSIFDEVNIAVNFSDDSFVTGDIRNSLDDFKNSGVNTVNISAFDQQIEAQLVTFDISSTREQLVTLRGTIITECGGVPQCISLINDINNAISQLDAISNQTVMLQTQVDLVDQGVQVLSDKANATVASAEEILDRTDMILSDLNGAEGFEFFEESATETYDRVVGYVDTFENHLLTSIRTELGGCEPVYRIYTYLHNQLCRAPVDGLVGFWWSLGFCALLLVPTIVFSVIAAHFYLRMKDYDPTDMDNIEMPQSNLQEGGTGTGTYTKMDLAY